MDALTSNIEQREMALHAINSQFTTQAKQMVAQIQTLEEQNAKLQEKSKEVEAVSKQNAKLQERVKKLAQEKENLSKKRKEDEEKRTQTEREAADAMDSLQAKDVRQKLNDPELHVSREEVTPLRSEERKPEMSPPNTTQVSQLEQTVSSLEKDRSRLHHDLQQCLFEIHRRDQYIQQVAHKARDTLCSRWSRTKPLCPLSSAPVSQSHQQEALFTEVAPGAPQERSRETETAAQLTDRLQELEQNLSEERTRREAAEEALISAEDRLKLLQTREVPRDFSIDMEPDEEWDAVSLDPSQPLISRKVRGSALLCRQWLRGRSLYFSRILRSRTRAPYLFMGYLLTLHVLLLLCLTGAL
ncbi:hypothetical protein WMY93_012567 [Mugilogobius chulae]|uniref:Golgin-84 n=1 Tax=Mugilogobius chulae TaxID=88201 RepID=A0AAW0P3X9_9GOBI